MNANKEYGYLTALTPDEIKAWEYKYGDECFHAGESWSACLDYAECRVKPRRRQISVGPDYDLVPLDGVLNNKSEFTTDGITWIHWRPTTNHLPKEIIRIFRPDIQAFRHRKTTIVENKDCCPDWTPNMEKVNGPIVLQSIRSGGAYQYDGLQFKYCPWCGKERPALPVVKSPEDAAWEKFDPMDFKLKIQYEAFIAGFRAAKEQSK